MALADFTAYRAAIANPQQKIGWTKTITLPNTSSGQALVSGWTFAPFAGATPTSAATVDRTTTGALGQFNAATELRMFLDAITAQVNSIQGTQFALIIADRLVHMGGLSGTVTTAQTVNTVAIPRYTASTDRLCAALEIYGALGVTSTTATASYTNQGGTAGQTTPAITIGASNNRSAVGVFMPLSLAAGDTGFKSVETVTLAASTGSVGNFGVTIYKPLLALPIIAGLEGNWKYDPVTKLGALMPLIQSSACLFPIIMPMSAISGVLTLNLGCQFNFFED